MGNGALPHGPSYRAHPRLYLSGGGNASNLRQLLGEQRKCMDERLRPPSTRIGALLFPDAILKAEFEANAVLRKGDGYQGRSYLISLISLFSRRAKIAIQRPKPAGTVRAPNASSHGGGACVPPAALASTDGKRAVERRKEPHHNSGSDHRYNRDHDKKNSLFKGSHPHPRGHALIPPASRGGGGVERAVALQNIDHRARCPLPAASSLDHGRHGLFLHGSGPITGRLKEWRRPVYW
jgi:hypothetical protein